jgi:hypothetical protein
MIIDYIVACCVLAVGLVLILVKVVSDQNRPSQSNNDGGLPIEFDIPELDLPPGVTLPVGGPEVNKKDKVSAR